MLQTRLVELPTSPDAASWADDLKNVMELRRKTAQRHGDWKTSLGFEKGEMSGRFGDNKETQYGYSIFFFGKGRGVKPKLGLEKCPCICVSPKRSPGTQEDQNTSAYVLNEHDLYVAQDEQ
jgi:hypothetical protein